MHCCLPIKCAMEVALPVLILLRACSASFSWHDGQLYTPSYRSHASGGITSTTARISQQLYNNNGVGFKWMASKYSEAEPTASTINLEADINDDSVDEDNDYGVDDDENARSQFGTRQYWDDVYLGQGDFPAEGYCKNGYVARFPSIRYFFLHVRCLQLLYPFVSGDVFSVLVKIHGNQKCRNRINYTLPKTIKFIF